MNRAERREKSRNKYISRVKKWFQFSGTEDKSWNEFLKNNKWVKLLKHNKLYGRSTMNNMEKKHTNKRLREESKRINILED